MTVTLLFCKQTICPQTIIGNEQDPSPLTDCHWIKNEKLSTTRCPLLVQNCSMFNGLAKIWTRKTFLQFGLSSVVIWIVENTHHPFAPSYKMIVTIQIGHMITASIV